jgi:hypothetical protein
VKALTLELLPLLGEAMLVLADRNFPGYDLWGQAAATGADGPAVAGRVEFSRYPCARSWPTAATYRPWPRPKTRRAGVAPIIVRVVEYHLLPTDGNPTETFWPRALA